MNETQIISLRPALAELERAAVWAYQVVGERPDDLPPITVTIQTKGKKAYCAWFQPNRWSTKEGQAVHEINLSAEHLKDSPLDIIGYIVHEVCHLFNNDTGVKDTSKGGRHNKKFAEPAQELFGLLPCGAEKAPWNSTKPGPELLDRIEKEFQPDYAALSLFMTIPEKKASRKSTRSWHCGGDTASCVKVQVPAKRELQATCDACGGTYFTDEVLEEN